MTPVAAIAAPASGGPTLTIRGTPYPVLLPKLSDARLHLAAVIISLQVLGQVAFGFNLSIAQILISLGTCAVLEMSIAFRQQRVIMWPASAMLTGNGVAFVLRVPATRHGDWWSTQGWWIFAGTAAVSLLSKHVIRIKGRHVFNPSNFGLVLCFLVLGSSRAEPLFFWWAPLSAWMVLALCIIVTGGLVILARLGLLAIAVAFWVSFAVGLGVLAATGHAMSARWHLGPLSGAAFWWTLVSSPEILVFLFFMITDPKTIPAGRRARLAYAVSIGLLAVLLIAPARSEFWSKVAVLGSLVIVCAAMPVLERLRRPRLARASGRPPRGGRSRGVRRRARRGRRAGTLGRGRAGRRRRGAAAGDRDSPVARRVDRAQPHDGACNHVGSGLEPRHHPREGRPRARVARARSRARPAARRRRALERRTARDVQAEAGGRPLGDRPEQRASSSRLRNCRSLRRSPASGSSRSARRSA